jgi:HEAT repeat protein
MRHSPADNDYEGWVAQLGVPSGRQRAKLHLLASGRRALPAVRHGLQHQKTIVRRQCVNILDHLVDEDSLSVLASSLDDADPGVRARALHALSCDRCKEGACRPAEELWVPRALELLGHPDPDLRAAAIDALGRVAARRSDASKALAIAAQREVDKGLRGMAGGRLVAAGSSRRDSRGRERSGPVEDLSASRARNASRR